MTAPTPQPGEVRDFDGWDYVWQDAGRGCGYEWIERSAWDGRGWARPMLDRALATTLPIASDCGCCERVHLRHVPAVVLWTGPLGNVEPLCQRHVDMWLDNADDDTSLEPRTIRWLDGSRTLAGAA